MRWLPALALGVQTLAAAAIGAAGAPDVPAVPYTVTRVSDRVIVLDCLNVNVTAIATDSGIVVIDTNRSPGVMRRLRGAIEEEFGRRDFVYVINTHGDQDHTSGNRAFPSVPLVAHQDYGAYVGHAKAATLRNSWSLRNRLEVARTRYDSLDHDSGEAQALRSRITELESLTPDPQSGSAVRSPTVTFRDSLLLDLGDLTLELRFCGEAHTNHDIIVYVPEEKVLLTGDLICSPQSPCFAINAMADVPGLMRGLEGVLRREAGLETVVPGHGKLLNRSDLAGFCRILSEQYGQLRIENSAAWVLSRAIEKEGIGAALERCRPPGSPGDRATLDWSEGEFGTLGVRLMRRGMTAEAVSVLELSVGAFPGSSFLYGCLGDALLENGDAEGAVAAYGRSLELLPDNRHAVEMLEALR